LLEAILIKDLPFFFKLV